MKKAVRIMKNPHIMLEAFRKFNFDRYVYSREGENNENIQLLK